MEVSGIISTNTRSVLPWACHVRDYGPGGPTGEFLIAFQPNLALRTTDGNDIFFRGSPALDRVMLERIAWYVGLSGEQLLEQMTKSGLTTQAKYRGCYQYYDYEIALCNCREYAADIARQYYLRSFVW